VKRVSLTPPAIRCAVFLLASSATIHATAQKTAADIKARMVGHPLYLRGQWDADKLVFDDAGQLQGTAGSTSFTLSGIEIDFVKLSSKELELDGQRVGLEFTKDVPKLVRLNLMGRFGATSPEEVNIKIKAPANGDFTAALNAIFTETIGDLALPECWQQYVRKHLSPATESATDGSALPGDAHASQSPESAGLRKIGGAVTAPRLLTSGEPQFSPAARAMKYQGSVLISMIVGQDGVPAHVQVLRPAGLGLDERAVAAVSRYTFDPAMQGEHPVPVMLNVEVNFQIF
jgi:TonB family protein